MGLRSRCSSPLSKKTALMGLWQGLNGWLGRGELGGCPLPLAPRRMTAWTGKASIVQICANYCASRLPLQPKTSIRTAFRNNFTLPSYQEMLFMR